MKTLKGWLQVIMNTPMFADQTITPHTMQTKPVQVIDCTSAHLAEYKRHGNETKGIGTMTIQPWKTLKFGTLTYTYMYVSFCGCS